MLGSSGGDEPTNVYSKEIGNYRIIAEINSGAYGSVYKAEHTHLAGRTVKCLPPSRLWPPFDDEIWKSSEATRKQRKRREEEKKMRFSGCFKM